jgi:hypothetical protein
LGCPPPLHAQTLARGPLAAVRLHQTVGSGKARAAVRGLEDQTDNDKAREIFWKPLSWLGTIRPTSANDAFDPALWETFISTTLGLEVPTLAALPRLHSSPLAKCGCKKFCMDFHGDHTSTCTSRIMFPQWGTESAPARRWLPAAGGDRAWAARTGSWPMRMCGDIFAAARLWRGRLLTTGRLSCHDPIVVCTGRGVKVAVVGRSVARACSGRGAAI